MDQTSGTIPTEAPLQGQQAPPVQAPAAEQPGFGSRGRIRRRARFLRRARELAYRDLGGLVFNLHRFGERNDSLVLAKLATLSHIDTELRTIESSLGQRSPITVLREAGITACPRCAAIHGSEDRFCPNCGLPLSRHVDLPIAGGGAAATPPPTPATVQPPAVTPQPSAVTVQPAPMPAQPPAGAPVTAGGLLAEEPSTAEGVPGPGRSPSPPARAATPAATPVARQAEPGDSTEVLRPRTPGQ